MKKISFVFLGTTLLISSYNYCAENGLGFNREEPDAEFNTGDSSGSRSSDFYRNYSMPFFMPQAFPFRTRLEFASTDAAVALWQGVLMRLGSIAVDAMFHPRQTLGALKEGYHKAKKAALGLQGRSYETPGDRKRKERLRYSKRLQQLNITLTKQKIEEQKLHTESLKLNNTLKQLRIQQESLKLIKQENLKLLAIKDPNKIEETETKNKVPHDLD